MKKQIYTDFLIIGAGIIGLSIAYKLKQQFPDSKILIIEKEKEIGFHASGRNSGVLHAGFYYTSDSIKAKLCKAGNEAWRNYCEENKLRINRCGKLVVARNEVELEGIHVLHKRGVANNVILDVISDEEATEIEPKAKTYEKALWSPTTATVDPIEVILSIKDKLLSLGVEILLDVKFIHKTDKAIQTNIGEISAGYLVNAAGLYADKIAKEFGFSENYQILPFKGLYLYASDKGLKLKTNIYPVPNLNNPFLGVHFTVTAFNKTKIGPTAIPAFWRENYKGFDRFNLNELIDILSVESGLFLANKFNFRRLAYEEMAKFYKNNLVNLAGSLLYEVDDSTNYSWGKPGIRAQLINSKTRTLEMDFKF